MEKTFGLHGPIAAVVLAGMLLGGLIYATAAQDFPAQDFPAPGKHVGGIDQEMNQLTDKLDLNATQRKQVLGAILQRHEEVVALFDRYPTQSRQALAPDLRAIRNHTNQEINGFLTAHQRALENATE